MFSVYANKVTPGRFPGAFRLGAGHQGLTMWLEGCNSGPAQGWGGGVEIEFSRVVNVMKPQ